MFPHFGLPLPTFKHAATYHLLTTSVRAVPALQSWHKGFKIATQPPWHLSLPFCLTSTASTRCHPTDGYDDLSFYHSRDRELHILKQSICSKLLCLPLRGAMCLGGQESCESAPVMVLSLFLFIDLLQSLLACNSWKFDLLLFLRQVLLLFY